MNVIIKLQGRALNTDHITHAIVNKDQVSLYPVEYHMVTLGGEEAQQALAAMKLAGFVRAEGSDTLVNPARVSVVEDHASNVRVYLEGADRLLYLPPAIVDLLFPAQESTPLTATTEAKPRRSKKASE